ncbi:MAG TPA: GNAT family N-acetyltransferase [Solirubrobacteraceae bacterium]|jgi:L-amino acid N-acyltransferase YncA
MITRAPTQEDQPWLLEFLAAVPDSDRNFFRESVSDPDIVRRWFDDPPAIHLVAVDDGGRVCGHAEVRRRTGWSAHVGEIAVIVRPEHRGRGVGGSLTRAALLDAVAGGMTRIVVEVVAEQVPTVEMFKALGFEPEALLRGFVRDQAGQEHDLMVLTHRVEELWADMRGLGIMDEAL